MPRIGLILEGGGMRGVYTSGVLDFFIDANLHFKNIIGVSAGACNAISYISNQRGRSIDINLTFCRDRRYLSMTGLATRRSVFGFEFMLNDIPDKLIPFDYDAFAGSGCDFTAVATDCDTGQPVYLKVNDMHTQGNIIQASSSIPLFARIVNIDGRRLLDGGMSDSIPIEYSLSQGNDYTVAVLTQHKGYRKPPLTMSKLRRKLYRNMPNLLKSMENRYLVYNKSLDLLDELEAQGKAVMIRPENPVEVTSFSRDPIQLKALYDLGYEDARKMYPRVLDLVKKAER